MTNRLQLISDQIIRKEYARLEREARRLIARGYGDLTRWSYQESISMGHMIPTFSPKQFRPRIEYKPSVN